MMLYFRLFAGLTSFISKRARSQAVSIGPEGTLEFSCMWSDPVEVRMEAAQNRDRDGDKAQHDRKGEQLRERSDSRRVARVGEPERLEHAPHAVIQVHAEKNHGDDVEQRDDRLFEP